MFETRKTKQLKEDLRRQTERADRYEQTITAMINDNSGTFKYLLDARYHAQEALWEDEK